MKLRFDRFLSVQLSRFLASNTRRQRPGTIPILMYHSISRDMHADTNPYYETVTTPEVFREHLQILLDEGYASITMDEYPVERRRTETARKTVALTFDDGFLDFSTNAAPLLRQFGFTATMYLPTGFIDGGNELLAGRPHLTWSMARDLQTAGICLGSHTVHHKKRYSGKPDFCSEVAESKAALEKNLGRPTLCFSYPYAFPDGRPEEVNHIRECLKQHGYTSGVTTRIGVSSPRHHVCTLPRLHISNWDDPQLFMAKLTGSYDWMRLPQAISKSIRNRLRS